MFVTLIAYLFGKKDIVQVGLYRIAFTKSFLAE